MNKTAQNHQPYSVHTPVMLQEVLDYLEPEKGKLILDATVGAAGHTLKLAKKGAEVIGIDCDQEILKIAQTKINNAKLSDQVTLKQGSFSKLKNLINNKKLDGALFDLGASSLHFDDPERGFSFRFDAPLDMRMDKSLQVTAQDLVNGLGRKELHELFTKYGQEQRARSIAEAIVDSRKGSPIKTTKDLVKIIESVKHRRGKIHPATKVFQALRIAVNDEINELKTALPSVLSLLKSQAVVVVISFHSLEDRVVKKLFKKKDPETWKILTPKPLTPKPEEITSNPRASSAKLRAIRKES